MPIVATILSERQVIFFCKSGLVALSTKDGKELWKFPYDFKTSTAASPIVSGDIVYCSAGYGVGGGACRITKQAGGFAATQLWQIPGNKEVANHWSTPICRNGYLYGMFSFKDYGKGPMKCVEVATGKVQWEQPGFGAGNVTLVNDKLLALSDKGELVVVEAAPTAYKEIARAKVVDGKCWSTPSFPGVERFVVAGKRVTA
jgi:outer membrane protein assembly factor BamB